MRTNAVVFAAVGGLALLLSSSAVADQGQATVQSSVLAFDDAGARFNVEHDRSAGTMTFRLADDSKIRITEAPTVTLKSEAGSRDVTLVAVEGQANTWQLSDDALKAERIDGTVRINVDGRAHTSSLALAPAPMPAEPMDAPAPTPAEPAVEAPAPTPTEPISAPVPMPAEPVINAAPASAKTVPEARPTGGCPRARALASTAPTAAAPLPPAPAPVLATGPRGGQIVVFDGGPRFEVVHDPAADAFVFTQLDESIQGRPVVIDSPPTVVVGDRTFAMTRVENDPRSWRLTGLDAAAASDARMRLSLSGRPLETSVRLNGLRASAR